LQTLGIDIEEQAGGVIIRTSYLQGCLINSQGDQRMAFAG
jgi:5-enolpyruvylshikimate-3-phosphate synthase